MAIQLIRLRLALATIAATIAVAGFFSSVSAQPIQPAQQAPKPQAAAPANPAKPLAEDPAVERRLNEISEEMRCLVCQNESLAGSRSELAQDLRREIRSMIASGKTNAEIRDFMVARYGDFVLYRPPVKSTTWLLWFGPFALLVAGVLAMVIVLRRRRMAASESTLSAADQAQARDVLKRGEL